MLQRMGRMGNGLVMICAIGFSALVLLQSLRACMSAQLLLPLAGAALAALVLVLGTFLPITPSAAPFVLFFLRFFLAAGVIFFLGGEPTQDFQTMYQAASQLAAGDHSYLETVYFFNWAYQSAFVAYQAVVLSLFGPGQLPLQLLNAAWLGGIGSLVYLIGNTFLSQRAAFAAALLYSVYPAPLMLSAVLTNQHLAIFLFYLGLWVLVRRQKVTLPSALAAGVLFACGNAIRPVGAIVILAAVLTGLLRFLLAEGRRSLRPLLAVGCGAASYFLVGLLLSQAIICSGVNPQGLANNQPMWKFLVGLNQDSAGCWNRSDYETYLSLPAKNARFAMEAETMRRLSVGPKALAQLAVRKSQIMWGDFEDLYWGFWHRDQPISLGPVTVSPNALQLLISRLDKGVYLAAFALAATGLCAGFFQRNRQETVLLLAMLFCGYFAVHLIVEVQSRYRYFIMPCVFLLAGWSLESLLLPKTFHRPARR